MKPLQVAVPGGRYPIWIGSGILERLPRLLRPGAPSSLHLVSDAAVFRLHGERVLAVLEKCGCPVSRTVVPPGEKSKAVGPLHRLWRDAVRAGIDRRGWVVALGGGVVGDLAGFAAASLLRGVALLQIPTSLLAMVDSSVGGKTGIDLPEGKNLVGAFHQPRAVIIDLEFLGTLPAREARAGWAEVIKAGAIRDARFFSFLERHGRKLVAGDRRSIEEAVRTACRIKAAVVSADEREAGLRMVLNFGHTLAHGLEAAAGYRGLLHGEAVAIGMAFAGRLGAALGIASPREGERVRALLERFGLPVRAPSRLRGRAAAVLAAIGRDKKKGPRGARWVMVPRIGRAEVREDIPWTAAAAAVEGFLADGR